MAVREMSERESRELLARGHVRHFVRVHDNQPYVVLVNYAFDAEEGSVSFPWRGRR